MKRTITSIFAVALALVIVLSLAACSGGSQADTSGSNSGSSQADSSGSNSGESKADSKESIEKMIIGKWQIEWTTNSGALNGDNENAGDKLRKTLEIFEDGKFSFERYNETQKESILSFKGTYAITEDKYIDLTNEKGEKYRFEFYSENNSISEVGSKDQLYTKVE